MNCHGIFQLAMYRNLLFLHSPIQLLSQSVPQKMPSNTLRYVLSRNCLTSKDFMTLTPKGIVGPHVFFAILEQVTGGLLWSNFV